MIGPVVNLNGTARSDLVDQWKNVVNATDALMQAMFEASPHGRDYQTVSPEDYRKDRQEWTANLDKASELHKWALDTALGILNQEK